MAEPVSLGTAISEQNKATVYNEKPFTNAVDYANRLNMWREGQKEKRALLAQKQSDADEQKLQGVLNHVTMDGIHEKVVPKLEREIAPLLLTAQDRSLPYKTRYQAINDANNKTKLAKVQSQAIQHYERIPYEQLNEEDKHNREVFDNSKSVDELAKLGNSPITGTGFTESGTPNARINHFLDTEKEKENEFKNIALATTGIDNVSRKPLYQVNKDILPQSIENAKNGLWDNVRFRDSWINNNTQYIKDKFIKDGVPISVIKGGTSPLANPTMEQLQGLLKDHPTVLKDLRQKFNTEMDDYSKRFFKDELKGISNSGSGASGRIIESPLDLNGNTEATVDYPVMGGDGKPVMENGAVKTQPQKVKRFGVVGIPQTGVLIPNSVLRNDDGSSDGGTGSTLLTTNQIGVSAVWNDMKNSTDPNSRILSNRELTAEQLDKANPNQFHYELVVHGTDPKGRAKSVPVQSVPTLMQSLTKGDKNLEAQTNYDLNKNKKVLAQKEAERMGKAGKQPQPTASSSGVIKTASGKTFTARGK